MRLKGISVCFIVLKAALCGSYVNFGVFKLYGDDTLDNVLNIAAKLILSIPQSDLLVFWFFKSLFVGIIYLFLSTTVGISKIVEIILFAVGMFGTRSHNIFVISWSGCVCLHFRNNLRRTDRIRWALTIRFFFFLKISTLICPPLRRYNDMYRLLFNVGQHFNVYF